MARGACLAAVVALSGALACSRSSTTPGAGQNDVGSVKLALLAAPGIAFSSATYALTGPNAFTRSETVDVSRSSTLSFVVGGVPAGSGYTMAVDAISTDGITTCAGSSPSFAVVAGQLALVSLKLDCREAPRTGSVAINGQINICPVLDGIEANPAEVLVGGSVALSAFAHDSDNGPSALTYRWTATSGTLGAPTSAASSFTCTEAGLASITVSAGDGDADPGCLASATVTITCTAGGAGGAGGLVTIVDPVTSSEADTDPAGLDADANGVRDDVDAYLATLEADGRKRAALTAFLRESTKMMLLGGASGTTRSAAVAQAQRVGRTIDCLHDLYIANLAAKQAILRNLRSALYDSEARLRAYNHASTLVSGTLLRAGQGCDASITGVSL